jgi:hypothetical protein
MTELHYAAYCGASRLGLQWRVIYRVLAHAFLIQVVQVTPHDYRRR